ncbi:MAG: bifunctional polysaccharide deacetylase/glycosyltransferase family 2 protein [Solirubrobacteraceae bacterium]
MGAKLSTASSDRPVFADPSGRRWKLILAWLCLAVLLSSGALYLLGHSLLASPAASRYHGCPTPVAVPLPALPASGAQVPVFGNGVLQEIVVIRHLPGNTVAVNAVGPCAGQIVHYLTPAEAKAVGKAPFAVERYGAIPKRQIALSFDDGPSIWTPKILDLLSSYHIPATFFVIGEDVAKYPQYVRREVKEGHLVGNHTLTHPDLPRLSDFWMRMQIYLADHLIRAATHRATLFYRNPYNGNDPASINLDIRSIYQAQKAGYIVVGQNTDTNDWQFKTEHAKPVPLAKLLRHPYPETKQGYLLLLHDGGGDRSETLAYLQQAIPWALAHGYVFTTLRWSVSAAPHAYSVVTPSLTDRITYWAARGIFDWITYLLLGLFLFGVASVVVLNTIFIVLACGQEWLARRRVPKVPALACLVTVVIAAYNEASVISKTIESLLRSTHDDLEIVVVNDGSTDRTLDVLHDLAEHHPQVKVIDQENRGKAAAVNRAFAEASSDFVVTGDADTIFAPETVSFLVDHLVRNKEVAAVAGLVRVGNIRGLLTAWQALEYVKSIAVTRTAEHVLHTITVVPGACAAWRRKAVLAVGGFDSRTLAEDCELTVRLQEAGWKIEQDNRAVAYTEAPEGLRRLYKQRIRWTYGNIQVFWMHRRMMFRSRYGLLGCFTIPYAMLSILMPVIFLPLLYAVMVGRVADGAGATLIPYLIAFTVADVVVSAVGVLVTRSSLWYLLVAPIFRVINEPLRAALLYNTVQRAAKGKVHGWNKLLRTGNVSLEAHGMGKLEPQGAVEVALARAGHEVGAAQARAASAPHAGGRGRSVFRARPFAETRRVRRGPEGGPGSGVESERPGPLDAGPEEHVGERGRRSGAGSSGDLRPGDAAEEQCLEGPGIRRKDASGLRPVRQDGVIAGKKVRERHV